MVLDAGGVLDVELVADEAGVDEGDVAVAADGLAVGEQAVAGRHDADGPGIHGHQGPEVAAHQVDPRDGAMPAAAALVGDCHRVRRRPAADPPGSA